jgi:hypothetical protein
MAAIIPAAPAPIIAIFKVCLYLYALDYTLFMF